MAGVARCWVGLGGGVGVMAVNWYYAISCCWS
jgi:hypothetical protein